MIINLESITKYTILMMIVMMMMILGPLARLGPSAAKSAFGLHSIDVSINKKNI